MQTFVPYNDFYKSAECLDRQRLGKQRVETLQILNSLAGKSKGWTNHPATKMWRNHELSLMEYGLAVCEVWVSRGYKDTCADKMLQLKSEFSAHSRFLPAWWGSDLVHSSHQSKLLQKHPDWYSQFGWTVPLDLDYHWPV